MNPYGLLLMAGICGYLIFEASRSLPRLTDPRSISLATSVSAGEAAARLGAAAGTAKHPIRHGDHVLWGHVVDTSLHLSAEPAAGERRRVGWNVELVANLEDASNGTVLRGTVDIAATNVLARGRRMLWIVPLVPGLVAIAAAVSRWGASDPGDLITPVAGCAVLSVGFVALRRSVERFAAEDATALVDMVGSIIESSGSPDHEIFGGLGSRTRG